MKPLRLVADDLTGALDTAAQFVGVGRALPVYLGGRLPSPLPGEMAVDSATRELDAASAASEAARLAGILLRESGAISYRKVDSLLRGHPGLELAATLRATLPRYCIVAPAFPLHGRVTRGGRQFQAGAPGPSGEDLGAALLSHGIPMVLARAGGPVPEGVSLWDAETDADLRRIADAGKELQSPVLWCGSGGLAAAIAGGRVPMAPALASPVLGLFGTDHPATAAQLERCGPVVLSIGDGESDAARVAARLGDPGVCLVRFALPPGTARAEAARRISGGFGRLAEKIPKPRTLIASGGETLRALCQALGTHHLEVVGQVIPGVPVSRFVGGRWDGTIVVSKSGGFGDEALLHRILSAAA